MSRKQIINRLKMIAEMDNDVTLDAENWYFRIASSTGSNKSLAKLYSIPEALVIEIKESYGED